MAMAINGHMHLSREIYMAAWKIKTVGDPADADAMSTTVLGGTVARQ